MFPSWGLQCIIIRQDSLHPLPSVPRGRVHGFYAVLDQVLDLLRQRGRVTYNALKRQFDLDDACLQDLKDEIIEAQRIAVDEDGRVLVWIGDVVVPPPLAAALALVQERPLVAHCHHGLGRLYGQTGRGAQARAALSTAIELSRDMEMTLWLPQAEAVLAQVE